MDVCVVMGGPLHWFPETISLGQWPLNISYFLAGSKSANTSIMPFWRRDEKLPILPAFVKGANILCECCPPNSPALWTLKIFDFIKARKCLFPLGVINEYGGGSGTPPVPTTSSFLPTQRIGTSSQQGQRNCAKGQKMINHSVKQMAVMVSQSDHILGHVEQLRRPWQGGQGYLGNSLLILGVAP